MTIPIPPDEALQVAYYGDQKNGSDHFDGLRAALRSGPMETT